MGRMTVVRLCAGRDGRKPATKHQRRSPRRLRRCHYRCAGGPVSRILSRTIIPLDAALLPAFISDLPGGFRFPGEPEKGPRGRDEQSRDCRRMGQPAISLPIWSCSVWGLPCLRALQPERCALTAPFHPYPRVCTRWRYLLCGTSRLGALTRRSRTLSGTLPCGVRTFLPRMTSTRQRPSSPPALLFYATCRTAPARHNACQLQMTGINAHRRKGCHS